MNDRRFDVIRLAGWLLYSIMGLIFSQIVVFISCNLGISFLLSIINVAQRWADSGETVRPPNKDKLRSLNCIGVRSLLPSNLHRSTCLRHSLEFKSIIRRIPFCFDHACRRGSSFNSFGRLGLALKAGLITVCLFVLEE